MNWYCYSIFLKKNHKAYVYVLKLWSNKWLLKFNSSKTKVLLFSEKEISVMAKLFFNGDRLEFVPVHRHLGLFFQKTLVGLILSIVL